ncbi:MAG: hypothetical protein QXE96_05930 [Candidatus Caldarchaeum sp.]|jgi:hypothetical protein
MIDKLLRAVALLPPLVLTFFALSRMDASNTFVFIGFFSLLFISATDRFKWAGIVLVYVPAAYTVSLLLTGVVYPFLGLAAGYIISAPAVFAISAYRSNVFTGLVGGYYASYVFALLLNNIASTGVLRPERLFITLVQNILGLFSTGTVNITPSNPEPELLFTVLTALATFALLASFAGNRLQTMNQPFLKTLLTTLALMSLSIFVSQLSPLLSPFFLLGSFAVLLTALMIWLRMSHE